jgi:hypothetical protein
VKRREWDGTVQVGSGKGRESVKRKDEEKVEERDASCNLPFKQAGLIKACEFQLGGQVAATLLKTFQHHCHALARKVKLAVRCPKGYIPWREELQ